MMAKVKIRDTAGIWVAHVEGDAALVRRLKRLRQGELVALEVDGVLGCWKRFRNYRSKESETPVDALRAVDGKTKEGWQGLCGKRRGEVVSLAEVSLVDLIGRGAEAGREAADEVLRAKAEVENVRRRAGREVVDARKFAVEGFARELLDVKDNLERAAAVEVGKGGDGGVGAMQEGVGLTLKQLDGVLGRFGVVEVEAGVGVRFDPEVHQAISTAMSEEVEAGHIVSVVQKGFLLKGRLLRAAMVVVGGEG